MLIAIETFPLYRTESFPRDCHFRTHLLQPYGLNLSLLMLVAWHL